MMNEEGKNVKELKLISDITKSYKPGQLGRKEGSISKTRERE
jgi:hypothetical protein